MSDSNVTPIRAGISMESAEPNPAPAGPIPPGGGGPYNPSMEARVAKLESSVEYIQRDIGEIKTDIRDIKKAVETDFRLLFGALILAVLGLASLMAKGFHWI